MYMYMTVSLMQLMHFFSCFSQDMRDQSGDQAESQQEVAERMIGNVRADVGAGDAGYSVAKYFEEEQDATSQYERASERRKETRKVFERLQVAAQEDAMHPETSGAAYASIETATQSRRPLEVPRLELSEHSAESQELSSSKLSVQLLPPAAFEVQTSKGEFLTPRTDISSVSWPVSNISTTIRHLQETDVTSASTEAFMNTTEELVQIREQLQLFKERKEKMKKVKEQRAQLRAWLHQIQTSDREGPSSVDTDVIVVEEELYLMEKELETLTQLVRQQKPHVVVLVDRAKQLTA